MAGLLVLARREQEVIVIGDSIRVVVVGIRDDKVRFGIDAPRGMPVHRLEVYEAIKREREGGDHE